MSTYFSKVIKAGERQREFNFRQLSSGADMKYHVDVPDDKGNRIIFQMYKDVEGRWKTSASVLPLWIHNAEDILNDVIAEQMLEQQAVKKR
jgi:uridine kinase